MRAGYADEDGERTLNPFGKSRPPRRGFGNSQGGDIESGLGRIRSEGEALGSEERKRRSHFDGNNVPHSSTMPAQNQQAGTSSAGTANNMDSIDKVVDGSRVNEHSQESQAGTSDTYVAEHPYPEDPISKPRKRRFHGLLDKAHKDHHGEEQVQKSETQTRKPKKTYSLWSQIRYTILNSWINVLIIAAPIGIALNFTTVNPVVVFVVNFIAIIPLAAMLSYATEEISLRTGETIGGLLNASFGYSSLFTSSMLLLIVHL